MKRSMINVLSIVMVVLAISSAAQATTTNYNVSPGDLTPGSSPFTYDTDSLPPESASGARQAGMGTRVSMPA